MAHAENLGKDSSGTYDRILRVTDPSIIERAFDTAGRLDMPVGKVGTITTIAVIAGANAAPALASDSLNSHERVSPATTLIQNTTPKTNPLTQKLVINPQTKKLSTLPDFDKQPAAKRHAENGSGHLASSAVAESSGLDHLIFKEEKLKPGDDLWVDQAMALFAQHPSNAQIERIVEEDESRGGIDALAKQKGISPEAVAADLPIGSSIEIAYPSSISTSLDGSGASTNNQANTKETIDVAPGECLSLEAVQHGETLSELLKDNPQFTADPNFVKAGSRLIIRDADYQATSTSKASYSKIAGKKAKSISVNAGSTTTATPSTTTSPGGAPVASQSTTSETSTTTPVTPKTTTATANGNTNTTATETTGTPPTQHSAGEAHTVVKTGVTKKELDGIKIVGIASHRAGLEHIVSHTLKYHRHVYLNHLKNLKETKLRHIQVSKEFCTNTLAPGLSEVKAFDYFVVCDDEDKTDAAGVVANLETEDPGLVTTRVEGGGTSSSPTSTYDEGWGIYQSTPGNKIWAVKEDYHVHGSITSLDTQLNLTRMQMHGTSPTNNWDMDAVLKDDAHTPAEAADIFEEDFEGAYDGGDLPDREAEANHVYAEMDHARPWRTYEELVKKSMIYTYKQHHHRKHSSSTHTGKTPAHAAPSSAEHKHEKVHHEHMHEKVHHEHMHEKVHHEHMHDKSHHDHMHRHSDRSNSSTGFVGWRLTGQHSMQSYDQCDPAWADLPYGLPGQTSICDSDCGGTSFTMINNTLGTNPMTVPEEAQKYGPDYHTVGTSWSFFPVAAEQNGLREWNIGKNLNMAGKILREGGLVEAAFGVGFFTTEGHFMVIRAETNGGNFYIANPANAGAIALGRGDTNHTEYNWRFLLDQGALQNMWAFLPGKSQSVTPSPSPVQKLPISSTKPGHHRPIVSHKQSHHSQDYGHYHQHHNQTKVDHHIRLNLGEATHSTLPVHTHEHHSLQNNHTKHNVGKTAVFHHTGLHKTAVVHTSPHKQPAVNKPPVNKPTHLTAPKPKQVHSHAH